MEPARRGPLEHNTGGRGGTIPVHVVKEVAARTGLELLPLMTQPCASQAAPDAANRPRGVRPRFQGRPIPTVGTTKTALAARTPSEEAGLGVSPDAIQAPEDMQATLARTVPCGAPCQELQVIPRRCSQGSPPEPGFGHSAVPCRRSRRSG